MAVSFIGGGNQSTRRKPSTWCTSLTNHVVSGTPCRERDYGNSTIVFNGKPIVFPYFAQSGIHKVRDIWDCETNDFNDSNFIKLVNSLIDKRNCTMNEVEKSNYRCS